jgi:hypothetical protein
VNYIQRLRKHFNYTEKAPEKRELHSKRIKKQLGSKRIKEDVK